MSGHTPGPWRVRKWSVDMRIKGSTHQVTDGDDYPTAFVPGWDTTLPGEANAADEAKANARLIAAAPDMLQALKEALATLTDEDACNIAPCIGSMNPHEHAAGLVQAAIAKAEAR